MARKKGGPNGSSLFMVLISKNHIGWKRRSGKKRFHSIRIPAVAVNQMAATTGAAVRNLFIVEGAMVEVV